MGCACQVGKEFAKMKPGLVGLQKKQLQQSYACIDQLLFDGRMKSSCQGHIKRDTNLGGDTVRRNLVPPYLATIRIIAVSWAY